MKPSLEIAVEISQCTQQVREFVTALLNENQKLMAKNETLRERINQTNQNSNTPSSVNPFVKPKSLRVKTGRKPGGQSGHKGITLHRFEVVDEVVEHAIDCCYNCGTDISNVQAHTQSRQVVDVVIKRIVTEHRVEEKYCPICGKLVASPFPDEVSHYLQYGPTLKSIMLCLNQGNFVPFERLSQISRDILGVPLSTGSLVNMVKECGENLKQSMNYIKKQLLQSDVIHSDETGLRVSGKTVWLHNASNEQYTYVETHEKRGNEATDAIGILKEFHGVLVHDFWKSYFMYDQCLHALCNAHILRELNGVVDNFKQEWAQEMITLLVELNTKVKQSGGFLVGSDLNVFKNRYDEILSAARTQNPSIAQPPSISKKRGRVAKSKPQNLIERMVEHKEDILRFTTDPQIPFDNNQAERDIRMSKIHQKVSGCFRSTDGNNAFGNIRSYISTAIKQGVSMFDAIQSAVSGKPMFIGDSQ